MDAGGVANGDDRQMKHKQVVEMRVVVAASVALVAMETNGVGV